jgi:hypothetical protein
MIGIDDFALRKNFSYGTIFINHENNTIVDIIQTRDRANVAEYLKKFKNLVIVTRDGSIAYRKAIEDVNSEIFQISDKFHLIKNLIDALKLDSKIVMERNIVLKEDIYDVSFYQINLSLNEKKKQARALAKQNLIDQIRADRKKGYSIKYLEEKYKMQNRTVRKYLETDAYIYRVHRTIELDKYSSQIYQFLLEEKNFHQIYTLIVQQGYKGSYPNFFKQLKHRITTNSLSNSFQVSRHAFSKLLYKNDIERLKLDIENEQLLKIYLAQDNEASRMIKIIEEFRNIFLSRNLPALDAWIAKYEK